MDQCISLTVTRDKVGLSPSCGSIVHLEDGRLMWVWGAGSAQEPLEPLRANYSSDDGKTWSDPVPLKLQSGDEFRGVIGPSVIRLSSGALGLSHVSAVRKGEHYLDRADSYKFHISRDQGRTWSGGVAINSDSIHANREGSVVHGLLQLSDGRLVLPFQKTIGPSPSVEQPDTCTRFGQTWSNCRSYNMMASFVYYSDDQGQTWQRSRNEVMATIDRGLGGCYSMGEPHVAELADGRLLLMAQTPLGQLFRTYSKDRGQTWQEAEPTGLVLRRSPLVLKRIPQTDDLLVIWSQVSPWEEMQGLYRHRLSCAVSKDGGLSWQGHKNLISLDDESCLKAESPQYCVLADRGNFCQPVDRQRYHRAPGPLRNDHPFCSFFGDKVIISHGQGVLGNRSVIEKTYGLDYLEEAEKFGFEPNPANPNKVMGSNRIHVAPISWLYS